MAYDREKIFALALETIPQEQCVTISELMVCLPISHQTFYDWGFDKSDELKKLIEAEKIKIKKHMRRNWRNSDNATLQIAEFKLISTDSELERLNTQKVNQSVTYTKPGINLYIGADIEGTNNNGEGDEADV